MLFRIFSKTEEIYNALITNSSLTLNPQHIVVSALSGEIENFVEENLGISLERFELSKSSLSNINGQVKIYLSNLLRDVLASENYESILS